MKQFNNIFFYLTIFTFAVGREPETESCEIGKLYHTPDCATINGYIILDASGKTFVFQHEVDEKFQKSGIDVCIEYQLSENKPLTAECTQGEIIIITSIKER